MKKIFFKNNTGITLIVLVVTIIVLLILAGISISMIAGENGILYRASEASEATRGGEVKEAVSLAIAENLMAKYASGSKIGREELIEQLSESGKLKPEEVTKLTDEDNPVDIITIGGIIIDFSQLPKETVNASLKPGETSTATETDNYTDTEGKTATVPKGYTVSNVEGEKLISQGLVITKDSDEYVWIEVPKAGGPDYSAVTSTTVDTDEYYTAIENALIAYAGFAKTGSDYKTTKLGWKDEWYDSLSHTYDGTKWYSYDGTEDASYTSGDATSTAGCGLTYEAYKTQYKKMLKSVYTNGGFWIGRYEGSSGATSSDAPLSQPNKATQTLTCSNAQIAAAKVATTDTGNTGTNTYTSSLMFGVQWDLVCKFLEGSTEWPAEYEASWYIKTDSSSWGNYAPDSDYHKKLTGSSTDYRRMNIFDFAGNEFEWTLEHATSDSDFPCALRGGNYGFSGSNYPASYRYSSSTSSSSGFRVSLY